MLKQVFKIDGDGIYKEPVILSDKEICPSDCIEIFPTPGLFKHKWNGQTWEEALTQEEIDAIKNTPQPLSELEQIKKQQADLTFTLMMNGVI